MQAATDLNLDISRSVMIGDALTDIAAGQAAGVAQTIIVQTGRGAAQIQLPQAAQYSPFIVCDTLTAAFIKLGVF